MTILVFRDRGWEVATSSWSIGSKGGTSTTLVYTWGEDGIGFTGSSVSTAKIKLAIAFDELLRRITASPGVCDLRDLR